MRTLIKALGIAVAAVAAVAALFAVAALLLWLLFDADTIREELQAFVAERTGREFSIDGGLALSLYPWLGVETGRMRLGQAPGFGDGDFASVDSAGARVRLLPLFRGRMEFGTVMLDGLELNLARDADGRGNWSDLRGSTSAGGGAGAAGATPDTGGGPFFSEVGIAGIDIRDGVVFWREDVDQVRHVISEISLGTGPIASGMPVDIDLGLRWVGVDPAFTARLDGSASLAAAPGAADYRADGLSLEFRVEDGQGGERVVGSLRASAAADTASRTVRLDNLELESDLAGFTASPGPVRVSAVAPSVEFDATAWTAEIPEAVSTIGGVAARWHLTAARLDGAPLFSGTVAVAESSIDRTLALLGMEHSARLGDFALRAGFESEPLAGRVALNGLEGALLDMAVSGNLALSGDRLTGELEAPAFDPGTLFSVLPSAWLAGANVAAIERLALGANFTLDRAGNGFSLRDIAVALPGATVSASVDGAAGGGRFTGRVAAREVDPEALADIFPALLPDALDPERLGGLGVATGFDYDAAGSVLRLDDLAASALGLRVSGDLIVRGPAGGRDIAGSLQVANFSPRTLLERLGGVVPPTADPDALRGADLSADVSFGANRAEFAALRMRLDDTRATGRVEVAGFADPRFTFELDLDRIDLDRYLPPASGAPPAPGGEDRAFDTSALANLNVSGRLNAGQLRVAGLDLAGVATAVHLAGGLGGIEPLEARLYGGGIDGAAQLDLRAGGPLVSLRGSLRDVDMEGLLTALSGEPAPISGTGRVDVELAGVGDNLDGVLSTATGSIEFALGDGALRGFNLDHALCDVYNRLRDHPPPAAATVDATPYSEVRGTARVRDGIARTDDLVGVLTSIGVGGAGRLDLVSRGIDFDLDAEMASPIGIPGCGTLDGLVGRSIPVSVGGTVAEPRIGPDFEELLRERLREEAREAVLDAVLDLL